MQTPPFILTIFGITGDLSRTKLIPSLYTLFLNKQLPELFFIYGFGRRAYATDDDYLDFVTSAITDHRHPNHSPEQLKAFRWHIRYNHGELDDPKAYETLADSLWHIQESLVHPIERIFYYAIPPEQYAPVSRQLKQAQLAGPSGLHAVVPRIIVEKPFGYDLHSSNELDSELHDIFQEEQIYRIDHFLGKSSVQNILPFRFEARTYEAFWNNAFIDHIQITVAESAGIGTRGGYYDHTGALRDMLQNHCLELLAHVTMGTPNDAAESIRHARTEALRTYTIEKIVTGQYEGYLSEDKVRLDSTTETFIAAKLSINAPRWHNVPVYIRTGKKLPEKTSEITVAFKPSEHEHVPSRIVFRIQPDAGTAVQLQDRTETLCEPLHPSRADAYGELILECLAGNTTYFIHSDEVRAAWSVVEPVLSQLRNKPHTYTPATWGPDLANDLLGDDNRTWLLHDFTACADKSYH